MTGNEGPTKTEIRTDSTFFGCRKEQPKKSISVAKGVIWQPKKRNEIGCNDSENKFLQPI